MGVRGSSGRCASANPAWPPHQGHFSETRIAGPQTCKLELSVENIESAEVPLMRRILLRTHLAPLQATQAQIFIVGLADSLYDALVFDIKPPPMRSSISHPDE